jgi:hypothetical protein
MCLFSYTRLAKFFFLFISIIKTTITPILICTSTYNNFVSARSLDLETEDKMKPINITRWNLQKDKRVFHPNMCNNIIIIAVVKIAQRKTRSNQNRNKQAKDTYTVTQNIQMQGETKNNYQCCLQSVLVLFLRQLKLSLTMCKCMNGW